MAATHTDAPAAGGALGERGFWGIFTAAWIAYVGLYLTAAFGEETLTPLQAVAMALANTLPAAGFAWVVALRRRDLLRPERSLAVTALVHAGVGLLFAVATSVVTMLLLAAGGLDDHPGRSAPASFFIHVIGALFLYVILAGFLMWTESIRRVHESRTLAAREAMLRAQAEAKAIRAQFNPHFVFNTLHSLMLLVRADPPAAERAIEDVAELIRYASVLQRRDVDLVPLSKELEVVRRYVALEKLRLEDRLDVQWTVEAEAGSVTIPAFALHTLIENAVKHGLETLPEGGVIRVRITDPDGALSLTVADDGAGADPEVVASASGHGLQLLARRLEALYGEAASMEWRTAPGEGFTVTLRIPQQLPPTELRAGGTP